MPHRRRVALPQAAVQVLANPWIGAAVDKCGPLRPTLCSLVVLAVSTLSFALALTASSRGQLGGWSLRACWVASRGASLAIAFRGAAQQSEGAYACACLYSTCAHANMDECVLVCHVVQCVAHAVRLQLWPGGRQLRWVGTTLTRPVAVFASAGRYYVLLASRAVRG